MLSATGSLALLLFSPQSILFKILTMPARPPAFCASLATVEIASILPSPLSCYYYADKTRKTSRMTQWEDLVSHYPFSQNLVVHNDL